MSYSLDFCKKVLKIRETEKLSMSGVTKLFGCLGIVTAFVFVSGNFSADGRLISEKS